MRIAVHQTNLMPWGGFFAKMRDCDLFVLQIHCQYEKQNYQNRFNMGNRWYTMPVHHGEPEICEQRYVQPEKNWNRMCLQLERKYPKIHEFDQFVSEYLFQMNIGIILKAAGLLGIHTPTVLDEPTDLRATDRLVWLCKKHGADEYLSGQGAHKYLEPEKFEAAGIVLSWQETKDEDKKPLLEIL